MENKEQMENKGKTRISGKKLAPALCIGLALSAIDAMAMSVSNWDLNDLGAAAQQDDPASPEGRISAIGEQAVASQRASQSMGQAWYALSQRMELDGKPLAKIYEEEGLDGFTLTAGSTDAAGACYTACYGNCYGNCYSNCYANCHSADS